VNYCPEDESDGWCIPCPLDRECSGSSFTCKDGLLRNRNQCLQTTLTDSNLSRLHRTIAAQIKAGSLTNRHDLSIFASSAQIPEEDAVAALLYNERYVFSDVRALDGEILVRPTEIPLFVTRLLCVLFLACSLACIEAQIYESQRR
jgi:hypothetical protein